MKVVRYHLPGVGSVSSRLFNESATVFAYLDQIREVDRLRTVDHLGAVRLAIDGAHHSRWEYTVTALALIDRMAALPSTGLKSEVKVGSERLTSSGEELMKAWALLLNLGHVHWTFSAERILLQEFWANRDARRELLDALPTDLRDWGAAVIRRGDYYSFYQVLGLVRLKHLASGEPSFALWQRLFGAYVQPPVSGQVRRMRSIFRRLRRVAYLGLDTQYTPGIVMVDIGRVLTDEVALERIAVQDDVGEGSEVESLDAYMARNIYLGAPVLHAMAEREEGLRSAVRAEMRLRPASAVIEDLSHGRMQQSVTPSPMVIATRFHVKAKPGFAAFVSPPSNPRLMEEGLRTSLKSRRAFGLPMVWPVPGTREWILQIHTRPEDRTSRAAAVCEALRALDREAKDIKRRMDFLPGVAVQELVVGEGAQAVVADGLRACISRDVRIEWGPTLGPAAVVGSRSECRQLVQRELRAIEKPPTNDARRAELDLLYTMLLGLPSNVVAVSIASIKLFEIDARTPFAEIDCMYMTETFARLQIVLGEAKTGTASKNSAAAQLKVTIGHLDAAGVTVGPVQTLTRRFRTGQVRARSRARANAQL